MCTATGQRAHQNERMIEQRISLLLNRFWKNATLLWVSDGSRVYQIEHDGKPAVLKVFTPMDIGRGRLEPDQDTLWRFERGLQRLGVRHLFHQFLEFGLRLGQTLRGITFVAGFALPGGLLQQVADLAILAARLRRA